MELPINPSGEAGYSHVRADVPNRVMIAFDQLTDGEKRNVLAALQAIGRDGLHASAGTVDITRLAGSEPLYELRAAPEVRVMLRAETGSSIEVLDIVRPAALRGFAHAG